MELQGKVIAVLEPRRGISARGEWVVQSFVIETHDAYPKKMVFDVFGEDRLQRFNIQVAQEINVSFDIDAHEYQGRWFNSIRAFDVRQVDPNAAVTPQPQAPNFGPAPAPSATPMPQPGPAPEAGSADDLPF
ncbi:DUF3127 domain-containing protein [Prevotella sp. A2931]|uniref:DUF3127 domain-containing protein n=1 Tax=Prevotella illustrans TaxID=2800387 RepID=A0ABS3M6G5_9BACT|nr:MULTISPECIES: DUF3127 domain-containing protein [Prevotella]MBO1363730.1 DUF3127 domain-containing protein [Prevotella illustrans]PTL25302.1 hypothetical protein C3V39_11560 [Prevotella sp. oral taxon 820]